MGSSNHKIIRSFLDKETAVKIIEFVDTINEQIILDDHHLKYLISKINGASYMYDISKTELTGMITSFQSGGHVMTQTLPETIYNLVDKISTTVLIPKDHVFLQIVNMNNGGKIEKHYDAAFSGYINYKCNISVLSSNYEFCIDDEFINIEQGDMYCFEASLYKHWTPNPFKGRRILLSFGFLVPYKDLGRNDEDPRIRMSNRIEKYFQR